MLLETLMNMEDIVSPGFWHLIQRNWDTVVQGSIESYTMGELEVVLALHADYLTIKGYHVSEADNGRAEANILIILATWTSTDLALEQHCCWTSRNCSFVIHQWEWEMLSTAAAMAYLWFEGVSRTALHQIRSSWRQGPAPPCTPSGQTSASTTSLPRYSPEQTPLAETINKTRLQILKICHNLTVKAWVFSPAQPWRSCCLCPGSLVINR